MAKSGIQGQRLPYLVIPLKGDVKVTHRKFNRRSGKIESVEGTEPAGWLVLFPRGHYLRIRTAAELIRYRLNVKPAPISQDGTLLHPSQNPEKSYQNMQADIVAQVKKISGSISVPNYDGVIDLPQHVTEERYA